MTVAEADKRLTEYQTSPVLKHFDVLITCSTAHAYKYTYMLLSRLGPSWKGGFNLNEFFCCCCLMVKRQMHLARSHLKADSLRSKFDPARSQRLLPLNHGRISGYIRGSVLPRYTAMHAVCRPMHTQDLGATRYRTMAL